ncbi:MAG TPA: Cna B-type domain-containing protein, partial [Erysipelotrichaceae bacterium]|nr:Cna B-type domain-containing protein [Erysipelotrichaceae bacterium]
QKNYDYGSGINPETPEMSDSFTLNIDNPLERRNAGYYRIPTYIDISVKKEWDDGENRDGKRPDSITIHLLANGVEAASAQ